MLMQYHALLQDDDDEEEDDEEGLEFVDADARIFDRYGPSAYEYFELLFRNACLSNMPHNLPTIDVQSLLVYIFPACFSCFVRCI